MSQDVVRGRRIVPAVPLQFSLLRGGAWLGVAWLPLTLTLVALVLRAYRLSIIGWVPDNYEQLRATERLLRLELPLSNLYSPGIALIMAPFVALFPDDIATLQGVIVAAGVA